MARKSVDLLSTQTLTATSLEATTSNLFQATTIQSRSASSGSFGIQQFSYNFPCCCYLGVFVGDWEVGK